jgi:hypothetical protein
MFFPPARGPANRRPYVRILADYSGLYSDAAPDCAGPHTFSGFGCNFSVPFAQKDARFAQTQIKTRANCVIR